MIDNKTPELESSVSRRKLLKLGVLACGAAVVGCNARNRSEPFEMELGDAATLKEGLNIFPLQQIAVVKQNDTLWGVKLVCTHQRCSLAPLPEDPLQLLCPCHGSRFGIDGAVLEGPAVDSLPLYPAKVNERGRVVVIRERRSEA